ncbi:MAG TPA: 30S ribosomal protein S7 [Bacillota bacterium]|nr:30S ribosomal protein S7 [Bacillota bacterium]
MPRRGGVPQRELLADPVYQSETVTRFINKLMRDGAKGQAQRIFYDAMDVVAERSKRGAMDVFEAAVKNTMPLLEVRARRVGGASYQVPTEVRPTRRMTLALRWLVQFSRSRTERGMVARLAGEIMDAANNAGGAVRRKEEVHRMAEANKAFAHYRW